MNQNHIPIDQWGRDHWTTYAYLGNRWLNHEGRINRENMRCNPRIHPHLAHRGSTGKYPTQLKGGAEVPDHDDWSCLEDAVSAGLLEEKGTGATPMYAFTALGWKVWHQLTEHVASHPSSWSATFVPTLEVTV